MAARRHKLAITLLISYYSLTILVHGNQTYSTDCPSLRCSKHGPIVKPPFRLTQAPQCGFDTIALSCSGGNTVLRLPSGGYNVTSIDYINSRLEITMHSWSRNCSWPQIAEPNVTGYHFIRPYSIELSWYNCSDVLPASISEYEVIAGPIPCLGSEGNLIYVAWSEIDATALPSICTKTRNSIFFTKVKNPTGFYSEYNFLYSEFKGMIRDFAASPVITLYWDENFINYCTMCKKKRWHLCEFDRRTKQPFCRESHMVRKVGISVGATFILLLGGIAFFYIHYRSKKKEIIRQKIENFLTNYRVMNSTRYTYNELKNITNRFKKSIGTGAFGTVYKGELSNGIPVAVKMLHKCAGGGEQFVNEVATLGRIHHVHVVRLLGFCSEGAKQALVYEFMENGSLDKYISSTRWRNRQFSMEEMLVVATGIAEGIKYLHQGCDQRILHFDIKPHNILLDHNLVPKISDFGLSKLCPKDQSYLTISAARGTMGYLAPEMYSRNFGAVSYKSDVYSFGMLILEMISGRKNIDQLMERGVESEEVYFSEWIYEQLAQGKDLGLVLDVGGNEEIAKKLAIVALWCIQWSPVDRPTMTRIVQMLGKNLQNLQMAPNPVMPSSNSVITSGQGC